VHNVLFSCTSLGIKHLSLSYVPSFFKVLLIYNSISSGYFEFGFSEKRQNNFVSPLLPSEVVYLKNDTLIDALA